MKSHLDRLRSHQADLQLFLFAAAGLIGAILQWIYPVQIGDEMMRLAQNLVVHGAFRDPFRVLPTGPTAMNPPLYPLMVACLIRMLRSQTLVYQAAGFGSILANAVTAMLLPRVSRLFFNDPLPGVIASVFWLFMLPCFPGWDTSYTAAGILLFCLLTADQEGVSRRQTWQTPLAGAIAGLLFLLNPSSVLVVMPWMAYVIWRGNESRVRTVRRLLVVSLILGLAIGGWCTRNLLVLGAFVSRTNLGPTLSASNNDCATPSMISEEFSGCHQRYNPNSSLFEAKALISLGEIRYDKLRAEQAKQWAVRHPQRFFTLTMNRFVAFWFPVVEDIPPGLEASAAHIEDSKLWVNWIRHQNQVAWAMRIATAFSIFGFVYMFFRREPAASFMIIVCVLYSPLYYIVVSDMRYRYPILWLSLLAAGYLIRLLEPSRAATTSGARR